jgi:hypothetical protein
VCSHRIDTEEFHRMLAGIVIDDTGVFNHKLREWEVPSLARIIASYPSAQLLIARPNGSGRQLGA